MQPLIIKQRSAGLAAWLNCLAPGLGLYYLEQRVQARWLLFLVMLPWFLWLLLPSQRLLPMLVLVLLISMASLLAVMMLSWRRASAMGPQIQSQEQHWYGYGLFWLGFVFLCLLWLALLLVKLGIIPFQVSGGNMVSTINKHDWVLMEMRQQQPLSLDRGDVVVLTHPDTGQTVLQRIVGLSGERVTLQDSSLFINGRWQSEPYLNPMAKQKNIAFAEVDITVPSDKVFVMADNRDGSRDNADWSALPKQQIEGRVMYHLDPRQFSWQELLTVVTGHSLSQ